MKVIFLNIFLFMAIISTACAEVEAGSDKPDEYLTRMFSYAGKHDIGALEEMRSEIQSRNDRTLNNGYSLALYIASPGKYEEQFVENFPTDHEGLINLWNIESGGLTPYFMYSVRSLESIAEKGNETAIEKIFTGLPHTDASVSVAFSEAAITALDKQPKKSLKALSLLGQKDRREIYSLTFEDIIMEPETFHSIRKNLEGLTPGANEKERIVITEISKLSPKSDPFLEESGEE